MAQNQLYTSVNNALTGISDTLSGKKKTDAKKEADKKAACEARGGVWDSASQTCKMPAATPTQSATNTPETPKPTKLSPEQKAKGGYVTDAQGNEFIQTPEQLKADKLDIARTQAGTGAQELINNQQEAQRLQARNAQLLQLAQQGLLTPEELQQIGGAEINWTQALGAGAVNVIPGIIGGAATGAIGGAAVGGIGAVPGAIGGAIVGGLGTFLTSVRGSIKAQQSGEFTADQSALTKGETYLRSLITDTNQNPQNAPENIAMFYKTLNLIDAAHAKTFRDSQQNLNKFLGNDGTTQLAKFDTFNQTMRNYYLSQFETALAAPDPSRVMITAEDLGIEE